MRFCLDQFPVRPGPHPAESIRNYVYRVHASNGHPINLRDERRPWFLGWLKEVGRCKSEGAIEAPFSEGFTPKDPLVSLCHGYFKYCTQCARDLGYQIWPTDYASTYICPLHLVALKSTCPVCDAPVDAPALSEGICRCGKPLTEDAGEPLPAGRAVWELALSRELGNPNLQKYVDRHRAALPPWLRELRLTELAELLGLLAKLDGSAAGSHREVRSRELLDCWPIRFHARLGDIARSWTGGDSAIIDRRYFLWRSRALRAFVSHVHCPEVARQIEQFFDAHRVSVGHIARGASELLVNPSVAKHGHVSRSQWTCEDVAQVLEWPVWAVVDAIKALEVPSVTLPYLRVTLESSLANEFVSRVRGYIPLDIAGDALGIKAVDLVGLMHVAGVQPRFLEVFTGKKSGRFKALQLICMASKKAIEKKVFSRCCRLVSAHERPLRKLIWDLPLREDHLRYKPFWHKRRPSDDRAQAAFAKIIFGILKGRILAFSIEEPLSLGDLYVEDSRARCTVSLLQGDA